MRKGSELDPTAKPWRTYPVQRRGGLYELSAQRSISCRAMVNFGGR